MKITVAVPKENKIGEKRVAITPNTIVNLLKLGVDVKIQNNLGFGIYVNDHLYNHNHVFIVKNIKDLYKNSNIVVKVQPPIEDEVLEMESNTILISYLYPLINQNIIKILLEKKITSIAMDLIPRISRAQSMDSLTSQASIIGYKAVLLAANHCNFFFPMLITAAGLIKPAKVLIIGIGIIGLQAIATAKRLGAQVDACDIRYETKEQAESLGAKFVDLMIHEDNKHKETYFKKNIINYDVIITCAGIFGKKAPKLIYRDVIEKMKPGSVIIDTMADFGGNCELIKPSKIVKYKGVTIIAPTNIPSSMSISASEMYAQNIINILKLILSSGKNIGDLRLEDEIIQSTMVTHNGALLKFEDIIK